MTITTSSYLKTQHLLAILSNGILHCYKLLARRKIELMALFLICPIARVQADCDWTDPAGSTNTINSSLPSQLLLQRDTPVGSVIHDSGWLPSTGGRNKVRCFGTYNYGGQFIIPPLPIPGYQEVYQTSVASIGIKLDGYYAAIPYALTTTVVNSPFYDFVTDSPAYRFRLIYLGGNATGTVAFNAPFAKSYLGKVVWHMLSINGSATVNYVACSVNSTSINVPLGDILATKFTGVGVTAGDKNFDLGLTCDRGTKINVSLAGKQNSDTSETSVLALTNAGQSGTAGGVGVQLLYGGTPLKINNNLLLKTSAGGQEALAFTARYYQTKTNVSVGRANSSATLNITYQ